MGSMMSFLVFDSASFVLVLTAATLLAIDSRVISASTQFKRAASQFGLCHLLALLLVS